ncbi:hypothetical protein Lalb_Chr08g0233531 [Lupinus albus]|uniref:Uncharacterized protein n=1 Tax=Lupinus albus TaxID=3870 RepID=A0A6A4Q3Z4_LUPAL|nr:hypothetical protein Lalb_Chr08g0233531 [Lupinus albus]
MCASFTLPHSHISISLSSPFNNLNSSFVKNLVHPQIPVPISIILVRCRTLSLL